MDLDLDIENYDSADLELFLGLDHAKMYSDADIETRVFAIRETLLASGNVDKRFVSKLVTFLDNAKQKLHNDIVVRRQQDKKYNMYSRKPSALPVQVRMDPAAHDEHVLNSDQPHQNDFGGGAANYRMLLEHKNKKRVVDSHELLVETPKSMHLLENGGSLSSAAGGAAGAGNGVAAATAANAAANAASVIPRPFRMLNPNEKRITT